MDDQIVRLVSIEPDADVDEIDPATLYHATFKVDTWDAEFTVSIGVLTADEDRVFALARHGFTIFLDDLRNATAAWRLAEPPDASVFLRSQKPDAPSRQGTA